MITLVAILGFALGGVPDEELVALDANCIGADIVGGARKRLLVVRDTGLALRDLAPDAGAAGEVVALERGAARTLAYCVAGEGAAERVYVLDDSRTVRTIDPISHEVATIVTEADTILPSGVFAMRFARDLDGDGDVDLAIPETTGFQLWFATASGLERWARVSHRVQIDVEVSSWRDSDPRAMQRIRIPDFFVADDNGDGVLDLSFRDENLVQYYWSGKDGRLPIEPTFVIDIEKIESSLPQRKEGILDTGNLLSILDSRVSAFARDVDADGVSDVVMQKGKNVLLYRGERERVRLQQPTAVLPTSGNLLAVALYDEDGDGKLDLFMLHVGDVSIAQVVLWLVYGGELRVDLFVYRQEKPLQFSRKPSSRRTVRLNLPSAKSTVDEARRVIDTLGGRLLQVPVVCDADGDGERDDLARLSADGLRVDMFLGAASGVDLTDPLSWIEVARHFDRDARGETERTISIEEAVSWLPLLGVELHERTLRQPAAESIDLAATALGERGASTLWAIDLDGNGHDDLALLERGAKDAPPRLLFVRRG